MTTLKGMTWRHPRGFDPMVATSKQWLAETGVEITWEQRSLQDFESYPVEDLARRYDLIVIDHPHVGQIAAENCLAPLDRPGREDMLARLAAQSVGQSFASYTWQGHQWALPIDAASQVQAYRPDALSGPVTRWSEVIAHAKRGEVITPLRAPHALMTFYTLAASLGTPCASAAADELISVAAGEAVIELMRELSGLVRPECWQMDPIAALESMSGADSAECLMPLTYGYLTYATEGFRQHRLAFADIPAAGQKGPIGSALGGTGIAVSAYSSAVEAAMDYAFWVASAATQRGPFAAAGGQPGNIEAWRDAAVNAPVHDFYRNTLATLDGAWVRPRFDGYMDFQKRGSTILEETIASAAPAAQAIASLNAAFREAASE